MFDALVTPVLECFRTVWGWENHHYTRVWRSGTGVGVAGDGDCVIPSVLMAPQCWSASLLYGAWSFMRRNSCTCMWRTWTGVDAAGDDSCGADIPPCALVAPVWECFALHHSGGPLNHSIQ